MDSTAQSSIDWAAEHARIRGEQATRVLGVQAERPASASLTIRVQGEIRGKGRPRFGRLKNGEVRTFTDSKTESAETWIRACAIEQVGQPVLLGALTLVVEIVVAIPPSWPQRKQANAETGRLRPTGKPDADNTLKLLCDALNNIVWKDDSQLVDVRVSKRYGRAPGAVLQIDAAELPLPLLVEPDRRGMRR